MTRRTCSEQPDILTASAEGRALPPPLASHLASCASCREQRDAVLVLLRLADTADAPHQLPDPAVVWWKAQLARRWQSERAAAAPIERMRAIELAAGFACLAIFLAWQWQGLVNLVSRAIPAGLAAVSAVPQTASPLTLVLAMGAAVTAGAAILAALHRRLSGISM